MPRQRVRHSKRIHRGWLQSIAEPDLLPLFEFAAEFEGAYLWGATEHANFDLCLGHLLQLADLLANDLAKLGRRMEGAIDRRIGEKMDEITAELADPVAVADVVERSHWNAATWRVNFKLGSAVEAADKPEYS